VTGIGGGAGSLLVGTEEDVEGAATLVVDVLERDDLLDDAAEEAWEDTVEGTTMMD
jgi:hypothetical protein